jgi:hypothetical protein
LTGTHGKHARTYINGYDLSAYLNSFGVTQTADTVETSAFSSSDKTYVVGLKDATVSAEGFFAGSTVETDYVFNQALGSTAIWSYYPAGPALSNAGYGVESIETSYEIMSPIDGVVSVTVEGQATIGADRILSHHSLTAVSSSGSETSIDATAASTRGATAYLQITNVSSTSYQLAVTIQESSAGITWADLISFTTIGGIRAERAISSSGSVKRFTRANWIVSSTVGSATFNVGMKRR